MQLENRFQIFLLMHLNMDGFFSVTSELVTELEFDTGTYQYAEPYGSITN